jgi:hypothetical protein
MAWVQPVSNLLSTGLQAYGLYSQGKLEQEAYNQNADLITQSAALEKEKITREATLMQGAQRAAYARSGVTISGSALDVMLNTATNYEYDKMIIDYNAKLQASQQRYYGQQAYSKGMFKVGQSLISGVAGFSSGFKIPTKTTTNTNRSNLITYDV